MSHLYRGDQTAEEDKVTRDRRDEKPLRIRNLVEVTRDLRREAQNCDTRICETERENVSVQEIMSLEFTI